MKSRAAFVMACLVLLNTSAAHAQLGNIFRAITGAIGGGAPPPPPSGSTATIGIRGMEEGGSTGQHGAASPEAGLLDTWSARPADATHAAQARGLASRPVTLAGGAATPSATTEKAAHSEGSKQP